jgi:hypothetical protein
MDNTKSCFIALFAGCPVALPSSIKYVFVSAISNCVILKVSQYFAPVDLFQCQRPDLNTGPCDVKVIVLPLCHRHWPASQSTISLPVAALKNCSGNSEIDAVMLNVNMRNAAMLIVAAP